MPKDGDPSMNAPDPSPLLALTTDAILPPPVPLPASAPRLVEALDIDALPAGAFTRLLVTTVHDGMGRPVRVPVIVAKGKREGPVFGITSALHGNELNGIPVIHRLLARLDPARLRGVVVAVVVANVPGFHRHQRRFSDGTDLNHIMPGHPKGTAPQVYGHRLLERLRIDRFNYLVDLHTASVGRINSLYVRADLKDETAARLAYTLRPQIVVHSSPSDYTLRGTAAELGIPAITVEIGNPQRFQPRYIKTTLAGLHALLAQAGMVSRRPITPATDPIVCARSYWIYTAHGGLLDVLPEVTQRLTAGQHIARMTDVFGDLIAEYDAPEAGIVIGRSVDPVAQTGDRVLHLGVLARPEDGLQKRPPPTPSAPVQPT